MSELFKPCPFCGAHLKPVKGRSDIAAHPPVEDAFCMFDKKLILDLEAWNRRATPTPDVVLVPKEPTPEMIEAAITCWVRENGGLELGPYQMWKAMVAAAISSRSARG